ncbi:porin [Crenobacter luteus]|uniref:Porin domain-containing protein n=1 Tax=Crenobacter luteus TaxID=1452487 RepID=A0A165F5Z5_9NEIS|nr:porin [Crenobacter luteus]KZE31629.1 hypothetical protein AVW16_00120 [Crenobacter luteus]
MNKKLIALAIATLPAAALADVTLYGRLAAGVEHDSVKTVDGQKLSQNNVEDYLSWIGFKGQEDLGNGLKALWQVESQVSLDGTNPEGSSVGRFASRDSFVGLAGDFGKIRLGKLTNAQRDMFDLDVWNNSNGANALDIFKRTAARPNNAVRYDSPDFAGFSASVLWGSGENKNTSANNKSSDVVNVGLTYRNAGFFVQYGHDQRKNVADTNTKGKADTLEAGYAANGLLVSVGLQRTTGYDWDEYAYYNETTGFTFNPGLKSKEAALTVAYSIGAITPKLSLAKGWDQKLDGQKLADTDYSQWIVGADYALSKRTKLTLAHGQLRFGDNAGYSVQSGNNTFAGIIDDVKKQNTTSLSMEHWF